MTEQDDMPLDPWARAALLAEGLDGGPTQEQRARMAGKLAAALGLSAAALLGSGGGGDGGGDDGGGGDGGAGGGDGGAGAGAAGAGAVAGAAGGTVAGKTAALVVGAVIAGGGIGATISELRPRSEPAPVVAKSEPREVVETPDAPAPVDAEAADAPDTSEVDDAAIVADAPVARDRAPRSDAAPRMTADELVRERQLIDVARSALRNNDLQLAGKSLVEHGMRFPHGVLVEEQRVLSIELAVAKGDAAGAATMASAFRRDYPRSVFRARVDELVPP